MHTVDMDAILGLDYDSSGQGEEDGAREAKVTDVSVVVIVFLLFFCFAFFSRRWLRFTVRSQYEPNGRNKASDIIHQNNNTERATVYHAHISRGAPFRVIAVKYS